MSSLIIGAPFGNYITRDGILSTIGTYTSEYRAGIFKRIWRVIKTVRYSRKLGGWINKLGLPNPGIDYLRPKDAEGKILSIHGFDDYDWEKVIYKASKFNIFGLELNPSCPNVTKTKIEESVKAAKYALKHTHRPVIVKLSPVRWMDFVVPLFDAGITNFHLCNTILCPGGGLSGKTLKQYSLWATAEVKQKYGDKVSIIGGGGITSADDIDDYLNAGATDVAVASMLLNPLNYHKLETFRDYIYNRKPNG